MREGGEEVLGGGVTQCSLGELVVCSDAEDSMSSAAEFVEGGAQDPCDDACSICLESFCDDDPATVTNCRHEYHLQCILEWSQRSKECPMCWQPLSWKDSKSQELLNAVEQERALRRHKAQAAQMYHRSSVEEYEFDRFASYGDENCIMQHLAAMAMGRAHPMSWREHIRSLPSTTAQGRPHYVLVSGAPAGAPSSPASSPPVASPPQTSNSETSLATVFTFPCYSAPTRDGHSANSSTPRSESLELDEHGTSSSESLDTFKSRLVAASTRYKEFLTKNTKGFRERFLQDLAIMQDLGARAREMSAGVYRTWVSVEPGTDRPDGSNSSSGQPSSAPHPPPDNPSDLVGSGSVSAGLPRSNSAVSPKSEPCYYT